MLSISGRSSRWLSGEWGDLVGWVSIISDLFIWLAFFSIPLLILFFVYKKENLPLIRLFWLGMICFLSISLTHLMDALLYWWPAYMLSTVVKVITALASVAYALSLLILFPAAMNLKTPKDYDRELKQREAAEKKLQKTKAEMEASNRQLMVKNEEVQQLASMVSHDLKEPLQSFTSVLDLLKRQAVKFENDDPKEYIEYLEHSSERMHTLITDLLDYARLGAKRELSTVDLEEVLSFVKDDLRALIESKNAIIRHEPLPSIKGYKTELRMLFQNLINNALKYSKPGIRPEIEISAHERKDDWLFVFDDNGRGISKEDQKKIFLIFETLDDEALRESTGIGLAHCKKIVEMHGGQIWVTSQLGEGSAFHFTISRILETEEL